MLPIEKLIKSKVPVVSPKWNVFTISDDNNLQVQHATNSLVVLFTHNKIKHSFDIILATGKHRLFTGNISDSTNIICPVNRIVFQTMKALYVTTN